MLTDVLLQRKDSKPVILDVCQQMLEPHQQSDLATIATVFDKLNGVYFDYLQYEMNLLVSGLIIG